MLLQFFELLLFWTYAAAASLNSLENAESVTKFTSKTSEARAMQMQRKNTVCPFLCSDTYKQSVTNAAMWASSTTNRRYSDDEGTKYLSYKEVWRKKFGKWS